MSPLSPLRALALGLALSSTLFASQKPAAKPERAFPSSSALGESLSPKALERLHDLVQGFVDDGDIVGAELLVIRNGRSVLHEGFGMKDREQGVAMDTGNVFCVRSMTKPLIGTSILMLASDKKLKLSDPVSKYLPSFSGEGSGAITIEHLLSHTSGLPLSLLLGKDLKTLDGIQAVAELGAQYELDFTPGSQFQYSDQGTDTLTALIEKVTGMTAAEFVQGRILTPLGMANSACVMTEGHPLRDRGCAKYGGAQGSWSRFWGLDDAALFPFFLGSQGLYSTLEDYGLFMEFWMKKGRSREGRLLRARFMRKALTPNEFPFPASTALRGLKASYGFLMQVWSGPKEKDASKTELKAFGHSGSDGTHAWVFPDQKAIVLYFTQSRGNTTGLRVEEALSEMFLGAEFDPNEMAPPFEQYMGYYAEDDKHRYQAFVRDGDDLALETPGRRLTKLVYMGEDRWKFRDAPSVIVYFERDKAGQVVSFRLGEGQEFRFEPKEDLPTIDQVIEKVKSAHRIDLLETLGPLRVTNTLTIEKLGLTGSVTNLTAWPNRFRADTKASGNFEHLTYDGTDIWYSSNARKPELVTDERAANYRTDNFIAIFGDWRNWYPKLEVIQRLEREGKPLLVIRTGDSSATATTFYVDEESGQVVRKEVIAVMDGMGRVGLGSNFGDFRDVSGMQLPFKTTTSIPASPIGAVELTVDSFEVGVEVPEGTFRIGDE